MGEARVATSTHSAIVALLSEARLSSYQAAARTTGQALRLYEWNVRASASIMELTGIVEVVTRNALDRALCGWAAKRTGGAWFDAAPLDPRGISDLTKARRRATQDGRRREVHGRVLAELTFGFWRYLVGSKYHASLWVPDLHSAFPHGPADLRARRHKVEQRLRELHIVRNRAAHHEPIHARDLERDHEYAIELLGWISPVAAEWAADTTSLRAVLATRPSP